MDSSLDTIELLHDLTTALWAIAGILFLNLGTGVLQLVLQIFYYTKIYGITKEYSEKIIKYLEEIEE